MQLPEVSAHHNGSTSFRHGRCWFGMLQLAQQSARLRNRQVTLVLYCSQTGNAVNTESWEVDSRIDTFSCAMIFINNISVSIKKPIRIITKKKLLKSQSDYGATMVKKKQKATSASVDIPEEMVKRALKVKATTTINQNVANYRLSSLPIQTKIHFLFKIQ